MAPRFIVSQAPATASSPAPNAHRRANGSVPLAEVSENPPQAYTPEPRAPVSAPVSTPVSTEVASALESASASPLQGDQLGKIRDILFGAQSRDQTRRVNSLEQRIERATQQNKARLDTLESVLASSTHALGERLQSQRVAARKASDELRAEQQEASVALERRIEQLEARLLLAIEELRHAQRRQDAALRGELQQLRLDATRGLESQRRALEDSRVSRVGLANMLSQVVSTLHQGEAST